MKIAVLALISIGLLGCSGNLKPEPESLTVLAASSLKKPIERIVKELQAESPQTQIRVSFGGSQDLAAQIAAGAPADVFLAAGTTYVDMLAEREKIDKSEAVPFASNQLAIAFRADLEPALQGMDDLVRPGLKLVLGDDKVPVGKLAREFLRRWEASAPGMEKRVMENAVSFELSDLALVAKLKLGEADAAIVFASDLPNESTLKLVPIPGKLNPRVLYFAAKLKGSKNPALADRFLKRLTDPSKGQTVFTECGFGPGLLQTGMPKSG